MAVTQYIGSRYVPIFADPAEWSAANAYEALTVVLHEGNSFTSKQPVPVGVDISNEAYWAETGNYNAQVEQYRREVSQAIERVDEIGNVIPSQEFSETNTVKSYVDANDTRIADDAAHAIEGETQLRIEGDDALSREIEELNAKVYPPRKNGVIAITAPRASWAQTGSHSLFYSDDGITFNHVDNVPTLTTNSNALMQLGGWFYHTNGNLYRTSKDLVNWSEDYQIAIDPSADMPTGVIWAGTIFEAKREEKIYFLCAREYKPSDGTFNGTGHAQRFFDIVAVEVTQNQESGVLTLVPNSQIAIISDGSHIDPYAINLKDESILLACKNEKTCKIELWTGNNIRSLTLQSATNPLVGVEAPQLITDGNDNVVLYVDGYSPRTIDRNVDANAVAQDGNRLPECSMKATIMSAGSIINKYLWEVCFYPDVMAHAGYLGVTEEILSILNNYTIVNSTVPKFDKTRMSLAEYNGAQAIRFYLANIPPFWNYTAGGNPTAAHYIVIKDTIRAFKPYCKSWLIGINSKYWLNNNFVFRNENQTTKIATNNCYEGGFFTMYDSDWAFQFPIVSA